MSNDKVFVTFIFNGNANTSHVARFASALAQTEADFSSNLIPGGQIIGVDENALNRVLPTLRQDLREAVNSSRNSGGKEQKLGTLGISVKTEKVPDQTSSFGPLEKPYSI